MSKKLINGTSRDRVLTMPVLSNHDNSEAIEPNRDICGRRPAARALWAHTDIAAQSAVKHVSKRFGVSWHEARMILAVHFGGKAAA